MSSSQVNMTSKTNIHKSYRPPHTRQSLVYGAQWLKIITCMLLQMLNLVHEWMNKWMKNVLQLCTITSVTFYKVVYRNVPTADLWMNLRTIWTEKRFTSGMSWRAELEKSVPIARPMKYVSTLGKYGFLVKGMRARPSSEDRLIIVTARKPYPHTVCRKTRDYTHKSYINPYATLVNPLTLC